jgi:hypothetical protein
VAALLGVIVSFVAMFLTFFVFNKIIHL